MIPGKKIVLALWLVCGMMVSLVLVAPFMGNPESRAAAVMTQSIDGKIGTTMELAAGSAAASLAVSALPGDTATPVADKLADFGSGFLLVLCVLYFEKFMFTVIGFLFFGLIVPAALCLITIGLFRENRIFRVLPVCLLLSGALIWLMIPAGLFVSDLVYASQRSVLQETIDASGDLSIEVEEGLEEETDGAEEAETAAGGTGAERSAGAVSGSGTEAPAVGTGGKTAGNEAGAAGFAEQLKEGAGEVLGRVVTTVSSFSSEMVKKAERLVTGFPRALALMIVTACVIPVAVMMFFLWIVKLIFQLGFAVSRPV